MPRKLTSRNLDHPHYQLKDFLQRVKIRLRSLSASDFKKQYDQEFELYNARIRKGEDIPLLNDWHHTRKAQMDWILERYEERFKASWKQNNGWDFHDIYDREKWAARMKTILEEENTPIPSDIMRNGEKITRAEFLTLPADEQETLRRDLHMRIAKINRSGYAGVSSEHGGRIVDRREFPNAVPIQRNAIFGIPDPRPLPASIMQKHKREAEEERNRLSSPEHAADAIGKVVDFVKACEEQQPEPAAT